MVLDVHIAGSLSFRTENITSSSSSRAATLLILACNQSCKQEGKFIAPSLTHRRANRILLSFWLEHSNAFYLSFSPCQPLPLPLLLPFLLQLLLTFESSAFPPRAVRVRVCERGSPLLKTKSPMSLHLRKPTGRRISGSNPMNTSKCKPTTKKRRLGRLPSGGSSHKNWGVTFPRRVECLRRPKKQEMNQ